MSTVRAITAEAAARVDAHLMDPEKGGFKLEQLMELAGLSVAETAFQLVHERATAEAGSRSGVVAVLCGPGNNGGDGLVAARHLTHFGLKPIVFVPKRVEREPFIGLMTQLRMLGVTVLTTLDDIDSVLSDAVLVVDAVFGFSFKGDVRAPFDQVIKALKSHEHKTLSVDIPSGWDVEKGSTTADEFSPHALISLTAPKICSRQFKGRHFIGGRFVPLGVQKEFNIDVPIYAGTQQSVEIANDSVV
ncbi:YjeF N-terminal domain-containing protein [Chytriomyces cf. hyalinus JEL632]|nr:YjeF N-terminal domain-containing protein [Chytriomyces cf. hyalinus JEL632]